ncbi:MAG: 4Fe-4S dicluster domain-containing protein [Gemmatimonadetes bacterium]|nr:4Fe-4S dicluster domain-containing protein [Gemmatimonadota bacterium]
MSLVSELRAQEERLLACVHCGFCLPACPTFTRLGDEADSPRGRLYLMRAVAEGRLDPAQDAFQIHIDRCLGCRACETVCPSGVEYGFLLERARREAMAARRPGPVARLMLAVFRRPRLLRLAMALSRLLRATGLPRLLAWPGRPLVGGTQLQFALAMLAASAAPRRRWEGAGSATGGARSRRGGGPRVALLDGCVQAGLFARVNEATARVLAVNGCEVTGAPGQVCCGALHAHAGDLEAARALARANIEAFETSGAELVAVNAAGCGAAMKEYSHLLADDASWGERAARFSARVKDATELLAELDPVRGGALPVRATCDAPCHLFHAQRIQTAPLAVLRAIPELELVALANADECCGGAGVYGLTHAELGRRILDDKVEAVRATGAAVVATGNPGCILQIGAGLLLAGLPVQVRHPVELLDQSYARAGYYAAGGEAGA